MVLEKLFEVKIIKLPENEGVGDAFSYPIAVIKYNKKPEKIKIIYD